MKDSTIQVREFKPWYKSKAVWTAIITGGIGVLQALGMTIPSWIYPILGAVGLYSLRVANTDLSK